MKLNCAKNLDSTISLLVLISPVFFLTVKHWTNLVVLILFVSCVYQLATDKDLRHLSLFSSKSLQFVGAMLIAPLVAIAVSQLIRLDFYLPNWDSPLRLVLCIPILLLVANGGSRLSTNRSNCQIWLTLVLPITLIWTLVFRVNWPTSWGPDLTTYFVDPLTFGNYTLLFSFLTLLGLSECWGNISLPNRLLCIFGVLSGTFLSIGSGSRTGWFNLPIFLFVWSFWVLKPKIGGKWTVLIIVVLMVLLGGMIWNNNYFFNKFLLVWSEISNYKADEMNADTSVSLRLSFYRMGFMLFVERPLSGWGDIGWMSQLNQLRLMQFASEYALESPKHGFHNEIITSAVRSGIWGMIASISLFGVVFVRAILGTMSKISNDDYRLVSLTLLVFICHLFIASLSTEVTNLIFLSSFVGLTLAILLGEQIYLEEKLKIVMFNTENFQNN